MKFYLFGETPGYWRFPIIKLLMIIKLATFIMIITSVHIYAEGYSQKITLKEKDTPISRVFTNIHLQSGYTFFYKKSLVDDITVSISLSDVTVEDALKEILKDRPLTFSVVDRTVVIQSRKLPVKPESTSSLVLPALISIAGTVHDETGQPLIGATVKIKGEATGTSTDINGNFSINADGNSVLVVSYTGFQTLEVPVSNRTRITIQLKESISNLNEVVVTALGITRDKKALAYSIAEVKGDELTQARENNLGNALSGRIAGVNASSTATGPGGTSRVVIRGNGSLAGDNQPLYVVNGVPINNSHQGGATGGDGLISINPDDIESLSVLKGGTAAALYGSRAANGVILITTKSGVSQKGLGVDFNSTYTMSNPLVIPDWQYEYGSGTRGQKPSTQGDAVANGRMSWGAKLDGSPVIQFDGVSRPYVAQKQNNQNFYDTGSTFSNTIALDGGNEAVRFRFSAANLKDAGIVPNSSLERNSFNLSVDGNISRKIIFEGNAQYNIETAKNRTSIADFTNNPNSSIGVMATSIDARTLNPGYDANGYEVPWNDYIFVTNPYFAINKVKNEDERRRLIGSFSTRYNFNDNLYARARAGIDYFNISGWEIGPTGRLTNIYGNYNTNRNTTYETNVEAILGFDKTFGKFSVNAIAGGNQMYNQRQSGGLSSGNLNVPFSYFISNGVSQSFSDSFGASAINSVFGSADVGFNSYLYLTLTGRQDWFSTLSKESNSLFYPSVGLSFVFTDAWRNTPSWLSYGKIRTSWAQVGGDAPGPYGLDLTYSAESVSLLGQPLMSINGSTVPNSLKPYTSTTAEAGIEIRALQNRIGADLTVYNKVTTDDIVRASVPTSSGYNSVSLNVGKMRNRGVELLLTGTPVKSSNGLTWDVSYNMAYNENSIVKIAEGLTSLTGGAARTDNARVNHYEGQPYGMISGFRVKKDANGNTVYNNANGLPLQGDFEGLARGVPPFTMGLANNFSYKNFSFEVLLDGKFGASMYVSTNAYGTYYGLDKRTVEGGVRESGVPVSGVDQNGAPFSTVVTAQNYYQGIAFSISDQFISDASFVKVRQLILGYSLPQTLIAKTPFQSASLSLVARNLWLLYSKVKNVDPESTYGISGSTYGLEMFGVPPTRNFGLNLMVRF